jgi:hypothetical protein
MHLAKIDQLDLLESRTHHAQRGSVPLDYSDRFRDPYATEPLPPDPGYEWIGRRSVRRYLDHVKDERGGAA